MNTLSHPQLLSDQVAAALTVHSAYLMLVCHAVRHPQRPQVQHTHNLPEGLHARPAACKLTQVPCNLKAHFQHRCT